MKAHNKSVLFILEDSTTKNEFILENRHFGVERVGEKLSESDLGIFEAKIGTQLPHQLRSFYLHWNGGLPYPIEIPENKSVWVRLHWKAGVDAAQVGPAACLSRLYSINADPNIDFFSFYSDFKDNIPQDVLCFASNPGSSLFLIGTKEYNLGIIYFWSSPYQADIGEGETPNYDNIAFVANSFTEFLLALREEPDDGESLEDWVKRVYHD
ncbi:MAG: SMI1/KNR4 family protein [Proteobacteria bacterium]|nr:SMI1/KNR4 family protein [Pseudomonadota bacterium]